MNIPRNIRVNAAFPFPALVQGSGPITVTKINGIWTIGYNGSALGVLNTAPPVAWSFANGTATPSIGTGYLQFTNSSAQNVTNFVGGSNGQLLFAYFGTANQTLVASASLKLKGAVNYTPTADSMMHFVNLLGEWFELSR